MDSLFAIIDIGWTNGVILIILMGMALWAMKSGILADISAGKDGFSFAQSKNDTTFTDHLSATIEGYDDVCITSSWRYALDNMPVFLPKVQQYQVLICLLEIISLNHILRSIQTTGFESYAKLKLNKILSGTGIKKREQTERYVISILEQFVHYARIAASKKVEVYKANSERKDLSDACKSKLKEKMIKNQAYLLLQTDYKYSVSDNS